MNKIIDPSIYREEIKMDQKYKTKWVNALRSGKFTQGKSILHNMDDDSYCCLGVLCHILEGEGLLRTDVVQESVSGQMYNAQRFGALKNFEMDSDVGLLPNAASKIVGLTEYDEYDEEQFNDDPSITFTDRDGEPMTACLSSANDTYNLTFSEIADAIEAQL